MPSDPAGHPPPSPGADRRERGEYKQLQVDAQGSGRGKAMQSGNGKDYK